MGYQSFEFLLFVGVVLIGYYLVPRKWQLWVLALANLSFYLIAGIKYVPFLLVTMVVTFVCGKKIGEVYDAYDEKLKLCTDPKEKKGIRNEAKKEAKKVLMVSLVVAIGLLAVCKYTTFTITNINGILKAFNLAEIKLFKMILPIGISFYTFMALSYVLDIYWKRYKAESNFLLYAVYLSYFPHVVQGPIDRFNEFKAQVQDGVARSYENITFGSQLMLWGFFKKLVVADRLGLFVNHALDNWNTTSGWVLIAAIAVYSIQIYTDFSGCIDIVTGVSEMLGIKLRKNFNHPYFSRNMAEFWRRWHISLQEWFKDYVYYPVSASDFVRNMKKHFKNKGQKRNEELFTSCFPILVVWMITGIWHGAAWNYVAWGMFHASLLIGSRVFEPVFTKINQFFGTDTENFGWYFFQMIRTYILCCIGRVFFIANTLTHAIQLFHRMFTELSIMGFANQVIDLYGKNVVKIVEGVLGMGIADIAIAVVAVFVLLIVDMLQEKIKVRETLAKQNLIFRWMIIYIGLFAVILFGIYGPGYDAASFIYEQF